MTLYARLIVVAVSALFIPQPSYPAITFTDASANLPSLYLSHATWADYDGDGDLDVALSGTPSNQTPQIFQCKLYRNDAGVFVDVGAGLEGGLGRFAWGDYDNDGDLDLAASGTTSTGDRVTRIYRNDGDQFTDIDAAVDVCGPTAWVDYDNDGDLDLAVAGLSAAGSSCKVYRNDRSSFTDIDAGLTGAYNCSLAWGDYDNDGDLDLVVAGDAGGLDSVAKLYRNDNGTFVDSGANLAGVYDCALAWGDYDNDGDLDLALAGWCQGRGRVALVYHNDNGNLSEISAGLTGVQYASLAWGDYDGDGDLDLAVAGDTGSGRMCRV